MKFGLMAGVVTALALAATTGAVAQTAKPLPDGEREIRALLDSSVAGWNRGDVRRHLMTNADSIWFMTKRGPMVGNDSVFARMTQGYFRPGQARQILRFDQLSVRALGSDHALVVGKFVLTGENKAEQSGWFTTVWARRTEGWRVIHDHSS